MTQYWEESKKDIFEVSYKVQLRDEIIPEWDDLVYYMFGLVFGGFCAELGLWNTTIAVR